MTKTRAALLCAAATVALTVSAELAQASSHFVKTIEYRRTETENKKEIKDHVSVEINAMQLAIIEALRLSTGQLTGNMREQTTADANMADVMDDRAVVGRVEQARMDAIKEAASGASTCAAISLASGGALLSGVGADRVALTEDLADWIEGETGPSANGADVARNARLNLHCQLYGTEADVQAGVCASATGGELANADVIASRSLLYANDQNGSRTLSSDRMKAAHAFIVNAFAPEPLGAMLPDEGKTIEGRELAAHRKQINARMTIPVNSANDYFARVAPRMTGAQKDKAEQLAKQVIGYSSGGNFPDGVSWWDWMDVMSKSWYMNPDWGIKMDTGSPGQAVKDLAMMQAFEVYQNWETYALLNDIRMNLATMTSILVDEHRQRILAAAR